MEELRRPPPGWEDAAGPLEGDAGGGGGGVKSGDDGEGGNVGVESRGGEGNGGPAGGTNANVTFSQIPDQGMNQGPNQGTNQGSNEGSSQGPNPPAGSFSDIQRFYRTRPCKYSSEMGCPYGDRCTFLHDEPSTQMSFKPARESFVATAFRTGSASRRGPAPAHSAGSISAADGVGGSINKRLTYWKTQLCEKWETAGNCPFGQKCLFAHGTADFKRYGARYEGGPIDHSSLEGVAASQINLKFGRNLSESIFGDGEDGLPSYPDTNPQIEKMWQSGGHLQQQTPRPSSGMGSSSSAVCKGPTTGISTIYGDWLEEFD